MTPRSNKQFPKPKRLSFEYQDLKKLTVAIGELEGIQTLSELQSKIFAALESFQEDALVCFEKFSLDGAHYEVIFNHYDSRTSNLAQFVELLPTHPFLDYLRSGGNELAVRSDELIPKAEWQKHPINNEIYIPNNIPYSLYSTVFIPESQLNINFTIARDKKFTDEEQALTRLYLEETRRIFTHLHLQTRSIESLLIRNCPLWGLSKRESEVITQAFKGKTDKEIAQALGNSPKTVHHQLESLYRKLGVRSRSEAIRRLLSPPTVMFPKPEH